MNYVVRVMFIAAALIAFTPTGTQAQQMYRWVDKDGRIHYTQQAPPSDATNVQRRAMSAGTAETSELPYATQLAARNFPVSLFTTPDCGGPCSDGRDSLEKRGIPFEEVVVNDEKKVEELRRLAGRTQVPVLRIGKQIEVGYQPEGWKSALDTAGYPASGPAVRARPRAEAPRPLPPVTLYVRADCGKLCDDARSLLVSRRVNFQEVDASTPETIEELTKLAGVVVVPVVVIGERLQRGFDAGFYHSLLDGAGFPRTAGEAARPAGVKAEAQAAPR